MSVIRAIDFSKKGHFPTVCSRFLSFSKVFCDKCDIKLTTNVLLSTLWNFLRLLTCLLLCFYFQKLMWRILLYFNFFLLCAQKFSVFGENSNVIDLNAVYLFRVVYFF